MVYFSQARQRFFASVQKLDKCFVEEFTPSLVFTEVLRSLLLGEETWCMDSTEAYVQSHRAETKALSCSWGGWRTIFTMVLFDFGGSYKSCALCVVSGLSLHIGQLRNQAEQLHPAYRAGQSEALQSQSARVRCPGKVDKIDIRWVSLPLNALDQTHLC